MKRAFLLLLTLNGLAGANPQRQISPLQIDLMRDAEDGEVHWALRCSRGIAGDTSVSCELKKQIGTIEISKTAVPLKHATRIIAAFLDRLPDRDLSDSEASFSRVPGSPFHWRVSNGKKLSQGAFLTHGSADQEKLVQETERRVLVLEVQLETLLIPLLR